MALTSPAAGGGAASQAQAGVEGCGMHLHVATHNTDARRLYERLGFVVTATEKDYHRMRWKPPVAGR